jgi:F-type H+-transporting ATPase subunit b
MNHYLILAAAEAHGAAAETGLAEQFGLNLPKFLAQLITFFILFWVLNKFAFKPVLETLEKRRQMIADSVANAERIRKELEEAEKTRAELIKKANVQANALLQEARVAADKVGGQKVQEAVAQAEALLRKAEDAAARDRERIMGELKQEMGKLVVATTAKVVGKTLTPDDQARLEKEALDSLKS